MTDRELQRHVEDALGWEPSIDAADVGVTVESGIVTLRGDVSSYAEKAAAAKGQAPSGQDPADDKQER